MYEEYDKPLHPPLQWKTMESEGRALDEAKLDSAIADLLSEEDPDEPEPAAVAPVTPAVFPELPRQEAMDEEDLPKDSGLAATLRQKWAELSRRGLNPCNSEWNRATLRARLWRYSHIF